MSNDNDFDQIIWKITLLVLDDRDYIIIVSQGGGGGGGVPASPRAPRNRFSSLKKSLR